MTGREPFDDGPFREFEHVIWERATEFERALAVRSRSYSGLPSDNTRGAQSRAPGGIDSSLFEQLVSVRADRGGRDDGDTR
jgi:hypothetical protein